MRALINIKQPTFSIYFGNGKAIVDLTKEEFKLLHEQITDLYNEHYELIEGDEDF